MSEVLLAVIAALSAMMGILMFRWAVPQSEVEQRLDVDDGFGLGVDELVIRDNITHINSASFDGPYSHGITFLVKSPREYRIANNVILPDPIKAKESTP